MQATPCLCPLSDVPVNAASPRTTWLKLPAAQAMTLTAARHSVLRVEQGRIWATRDGVPGKPAEDVVLGEGAQLPLSRGQRVVIESWSAGLAAPVWFSWQAVAR